MPLKKFVVYVSGGGTNLQLLIDKVHLQSGEIAAVISDTPGAYALERAAQAGIHSFAVDYRIFEDKRDFFKELFERTDQIHPSLIVLAGFMKILPAYFYEFYENQIINIHPSLIPSFCGAGFYGLKVHEAVLAYGAKVSGATVHFADAGADTGPVILQKAVAVEQDDTPQILQKRVLEAEHELLPKAVALFLEGKLTVRGRRVYIKRTGERT